LRQCHPAEWAWTFGGRATLVIWAQAAYITLCILIGMDVADLIRGARRAAGITQQSVAERAGTAQPAVAAYESGARTPSLATLERLLGACEHDIEVLAHPRTRRGAASLADLSRTIEQDLADGREMDALRLLFGFADDFRGSSRPGAIELIAQEPAATGDTRFDAALAGVAEFFAAERGIRAPAWVDQPERFVEPLWFVASRPEFDAYTLAHAPASFARHGVLIAREVFDRA
jgi:transcriptional regulator with XRE-family HTH domain